MRPRHDGVGSRKSAALVTLHRCASQFFSRDLLPRLQRRIHVDYQWLHYEDRLDGPIVVRRRNHVYGPIRILEREHPSYGLTEEILAACLNRELSALFVVRDPRDILVSMYYSFGFSHPLSPHAAIRDFQCRRRARIQALGLEEYVLQAASGLREKFARIEALSRQSRQRLVLRYEDMIENFASFYSRLNSFVRVDGGFYSEAHTLTRPEAAEDVLRHKRQGRPGDFRAKLAPGVIEELNRVFASVLQNFHYEGNGGTNAAGN